VQTSIEQLQQNLSASPALLEESRSSSALTSPETLLLALNPLSNQAVRSSAKAAHTTSNSLVRKRSRQCVRRAPIARRADSSISMSDEVRSELRNVAIVAHVDHGKTTLVDALLEEELDQTLDKDDRLMDGNDQEKERGITILAKNAAINYKGIKVNIVDTPGHADFGGEVERVLGMVDGVALVVDAQEGPKPQTRFVLKKALEMGHKILVVINKVDKPASRVEYVIDKTFDLFCELGATDEQTDFKVIYASAINRQAGTAADKLKDNMVDLQDALLELPKPKASISQSLQLQISNVGKDAFIGRLGVGRIKSGTISKGQQVGLSAGPGKEVKRQKVSELFVYDAMGKTPVDEASAGDIVVFAGIPDFNIGDTVVDLDDPRPLEPIAIEVPTMSITLGVNKSPLAGDKDVSGGTKLTGGMIQERLKEELETNVALQVERSQEDDSIKVIGRGLLHLTVLIENMRREGFELMVTPPQVLYHEEEGEKMEPHELVDVELPSEHSGSVIDMLGQRKGAMIEMGEVSAEGYQTLQYEVPTRCMVGVKTRIMSATKGMAVMTSTFAGYKPYAGDLPARQNGNLIATEAGVAATLGCQKAQERGELFIRPQDPIYERQILGISKIPGEMGINICRTKQLTNMRASGKDDSANLSPPKELSLEDAVEYIQGNEFVEVTPKAIRMGTVSTKR
jgi:GTP-binding protein